MLTVTAASASGRGLRGGALAVGHQQGHHQHHHGHGAIAGDVEQQARRAPPQPRHGQDGDRGDQGAGHHQREGEGGLLLGRQVVPTITSALISK